MSFKRGYGRVMLSSAKSDTVLIGLFEAKTHLSELVTRAEAGESITITRHGRAVACLVPAMRRSSAQEVRSRGDRVRAILADAGFTTTHEEIDELKRMGRS